MKLPVLAKKPLRDLSSFRASCTLLFIAMSAAVAAAMTFVVAWSVLDRETELSFLSTRPVHVEVIAERSMSSDVAEQWIGRLQQRHANSRPWRF